MTYLLDVNVLIALIDPGHVQHNIAHDWFARDGLSAWATCPITENGVLRIIGHASYPNSPGSPAAVAPLLRSMCLLDGHVFWSDDISLLDERRVDATRLLNSAQTTDSYLLALAHAHGGQLVTFDRRLVVSAVRDGAGDLCLIG
ncbi:PIN domain-containing protein [Oxalobacteraceae bacterium]|nr:PIN domain-containing protein [Oxalobacteraceae bacterium]